MQQLFIFVRQVSPYYVSKQQKWRHYTRPLSHSPPIAAFCRRHSLVLVLPEKKKALLLVTREEQHLLPAPSQAHRASEQQTIIPHVYLRKTHDVYKYYDVSQWGGGTMLCRSKHEQYLPRPKVRVNSRTSRTAKHNKARRRHQSPCGRHGIALLNFAITRFRNATFTYCLW